MGKQPVRMPPAVAPRDLDQGWIVCHDADRPVRDGRVVCPLQGRRVPIAACVVCHHLETMSDERDPRTGCEAPEDR
jgi:hypothetical protein